MTTHRMPLAHRKYPDRGSVSPSSVQGTQDPEAREPQKSPLGENRLSLFVRLLASETGEGWDR